MKPINRTLVVWDLGGTKCAAAVVTYDTLQNDFICQKECVIHLTDTSSLPDLSQKIEQQLQYKMQDADAICIGGAGQYDGQCLHLASGYPYPMNFAELAKTNHWPKFEIVHDYVPILCATFTSYLSNPRNIKYLNQGQLIPHGRRVALGMGTGLGLKDGALLEDGKFWLGVNEIGHIGVAFPPHCDSSHSARHLALMDYLGKLPQKNACFEQILSGPGIVNLYYFLHPDSKNVTPEIVGSIIRDEPNSEVSGMFSYYLGLLVGTIQLIFMPAGGIWITGGVTLHHLESFDHPEFFAGINSSPAYFSQRQNFPLGILHQPQHAFMGGAYYAVHRII